MPSFCLVANEWRGAEYDPDSRVETTRATGIVDARAIGLVACLPLVAASTGCMATFASLDPERRPDLGDRPSLSVSVVNEVRQLDNANEDAPTWFAPDDSRYVVEGLRECDCFTAVAATQAPGDLRVSVRLSRVAQNRVGLLTLLTAYLLPAFEDRQISIRASVEDPRSKAEGHAERTRDFRVWYELLLLPVHPFNSPALFEAKLVRQLAREAVTEAITRMRVSAS